MLQQVHKAQHCAQGLKMDHAIPNADWPSYLERVKAQSMQTLFGLQGIQRCVVHPNACHPAPATALCGPYRRAGIRNADALALTPSHLLQQPHPCNGTSWHQRHVSPHTGAATVSSWLPECMMIWSNKGVCLQPSCQVSVYDTTSVAEAVLET